MYKKEAEGEKITKEEKQVIEQISHILVSEKYITAKEQFRILELLRGEN